MKKGSLVAQLCLISILFMGFIASVKPGMEQEPTPEMNRVQLLLSPEGSQVSP